MRTLLLLLFWTSTASAQSVADAIMDSLKKSVNGTECEITLSEAQKLSSYSVYAAQQKDWDASFRYDEGAFRAIVTANTLCADEPENLEKAKTFLREHHEINIRLVCSYHASEAQSRITRAKLALEHFNDLDLAYFHARWSLYHFDEAIDRCAYDENKVVSLRVIKTQAIQTTDSLKREIDGRREDL